MDNVDETMGTLRRLLDEARAEQESWRKRWNEAMDKVNLLQGRQPPEQPDVVTQNEEARRERDGWRERLWWASDEVNKLRSLLATARKELDEIKRSTTRPSDDGLLTRLVSGFTCERAAALEAIDLMLRMDGEFKERIGTEDETDEDLSMLCHHERLVGYAMAFRRAAAELQSERMPAELQSERMPF